MKVCVYGAGAIGDWIGHELARLQARVKGLYPLG
jgi:ketopantoate reductase